ncbi:MAG: tRNA (N6-threonylcarbamoyladenosine(37)-N6)-methyltransferase TrmO [Candidatus Helarchaeota archaeon]
MEKYIIKPVGIVESNRKKVCLTSENEDLKLDMELAIKQHVEMAISKIIINKEYEECLEGIEDFSHLIISFWTHFITEKSRQIKKIHPAGIYKCPFKGIFATRSPIRPNPICQMTVRLLEKKGNILIVEDLDAVNGTPIIDIKPHLPMWDSPLNVKLAGWIGKLFDFLVKKAQSSKKYYSHFYSHLDWHSHPCLQLDPNSKHNSDSHIHPHNLK